MYQLVPTRAFLTKGVGISRDYLASFEDALRDAGIAALNIVTISSIFPPHCKLISKEKGVKELHDGQVGFCVMSRQSTNEYRRMIAASVGVAIPKDATRYGYLSELHDYGQNDEQLAGKLCDGVTRSVHQRREQHEADGELAVGQCHAACASGATCLMPISTSVRATAETTLRISFGSIAPMQPTRNVSSWVSLPGYRM